MAIKIEEPKDMPPIDITGLDIGILVLELWKQASVLRIGENDKQPKPITLDAVRKAIKLHSNEQGFYGLEYLEEKPIKISTIKYNNKLLLNVSGYVKYNGFVRLKAAVDIAENTKQTGNKIADKNVKTNS